MTLADAAPARRRAATGWIVLFVAIIILITLTPSNSFTRSALDFFSLAMPTPGDWFDAIANVALYVPLGLVLRSRTKSGGVVALTGTAFSCATELLQFAIPGRDPSFRDILANTLGSFAGAQLL